MRFDTFPAGGALENHEKATRFLERGYGYEGANALDFFGRHIGVLGGECITNIPCLSVLVQYADKILRSVRIPFDAYPFAARKRTL